MPIAPSGQWQISLVLGLGQNLETDILPYGVSEKGCQVFHLGTHIPVGFPKPKFFSLFCYGNRTQ